MGWVFPHCTAVPFIQKENCLYTMNEENVFRGSVAAWGSSGGRVHAKAKNLRRTGRMQNAQNDND